MASSFETFIRSKHVRVAVAVTLAATALLAFAPYVLTDVGGEAYVNAPLIRISSPIAGIAGNDIPATGSYVAIEKTLRLVNARTVDDAALGALTSQQAALVSALALAERQLGELAIADTRMVTRAAGYRRAAGGRLADWAVAARADALACTAEAGEAEAQMARVVALADKGFAANATVERARAGYAAADARCTALAARASASAEEAVAAEKDFISAMAPQTPPTPNSNAIGCCCGGRNSKRSLPMPGPGSPSWSTGFSLSASGSRRVLPMT